MVEPCATIVGSRGSGKSIGLEFDLYRIAWEGIYATLVIDPPGEVSKHMVGWLSANGMEDRIVYEPLSDVKRVLRWEFVKKSSQKELAEITDNEMNDNRFAQIFWANRQISQAEQKHKAYTKEYLDLAISVFRSQPTISDLRELYYCLKPRTKQHDKLMSLAADREAVTEFEEVEYRGARNPIQYEIETGAARRLIKPCLSPTAYLRHGTGINWTQLLKEKKQIYFDCSNVDEEAGRFVSICAAHEATEACKQYYDETGQPLFFLLVVDDAGARDLLTPYMINASRFQRKHGFSLWTVQQTIRDFPPDTFEQLLSLSERHLWYRMNDASGEEWASKDLTNVMYDPYEVYYERERVVSEGFEEVKTKGQSVTKTKSGSHTSETAGMTFLPRQHVVVDTTYKTSQLKRQELATRIAQFRTPGQRAVRDARGVTFEHVIPLGWNFKTKEIDPPWPLGLTEIRTKKAIERIRGKPEFQHVEFQPWNELPEPPRTPTSQASPTIPPPVRDSLLFG